MTASGAGTIAEQQIVRAFEKERLHHSLMFAGSNESAKWPTLLNLAKLVLCQDSQKGKPSGSNCACKSCSLLNTPIEDIIKGKAANNHPDLHIVQSKEDSNMIVVEDIRDVQELAETSSLISPNKFIILHNAQELNKAAANCLLKTLEEPISNSYFTLLVKSPMDVLETISSRSQVIYFPESITNGAQEAQATDIIKSAYNLINQNDWEQFIPFFTEHGQLNAKKISQAQKRQLSCDCIDALSTALRDRLFKQLNCENHLLYYPSLTETSSSPTHDQILKFMGILAEAKKNIQGNAKIDLICQTIVIQFQRS